MELKRFELSDGSSSKFWEISTNGNVIHRRYGRIGRKGATKETVCLSAYRAEDKARKLMREKRVKGYIAVPTTTKPPAPKPPLKKPPAPTPPPVVEEEEDTAPPVKGKYLIGRVEVHVTWHETQSTTEITSLEMVEDGEAEEIRTDYVDALPSSIWFSELVNDDTYIDDKLLDKKLGDLSKVIASSIVRGEPRSEPVQVPDAPQAPKPTSKRWSLKTKSPPRSAMITGKGAYQVKGMLKTLGFRYGLPAGSAKSAPSCWWVSIHKGDQDKFDELEAAVQRLDRRLSLHWA